MLERLHSRSLKPIDQDPGTSRDRGADFLGARREFSQNAQERFARDLHDDRVLGCSRGDPASSPGIESALADEGAGADASLAFRFGSIRNQGDRARMDEKTEISGLASEKQRVAGSEAPLLTGKGDELNRLARKQAERASAREPSDVVVERHSDRPPAAALATSL